MIKHIPISETRKIINTLASELDPDDTVSVTNRGKEVLAILPWETYEALIETLEIAADPESLKELRLGIQDYKEGKLIAFDEVKRSLDSI